MGDGERAHASPAGSISQVTRDGGSGADEPSRRLGLARVVVRDRELGGRHRLPDRTRLAILERLRDDGPLPVVEIARDLPVGRPAVSQHLKVLKDAGPVRDHAGAGDPAAHERR
jgi:Bacterial regulatory protein, arsR family